MFDKITTVVWPRSGQRPRVLDSDTFGIGIVESMAYTYILRSIKDGSYYVGSTRDLDGRIIRHKSGQVQSTKDRRPIVLVYFEELNTYSEARKRERQIKGWKKRAMIEKLIKGPAPA